nr:MBL fold metallo-hydrolase [uncultured Methanobrevibacter sp.]
MIIKAVKTIDHGFMTQGFAFGGEEGADKFDNSIKYRSSIQNFLIDTGDDVILVDTGVPSSFPINEPDETTPLFMGDQVTGYMDALKELGYEKEDVTKILLTHKHIDHSGEVKQFPNAEVYLSKTEAEELNYEGKNIIKVEFDDGAYHNFEKSQKIVDGVYLIEAIGHTTGNSLVIAEDDGLFYMFQGDITYTDEALYENKLSVVFEDIEKARETFDNVREFVKNNPTVYLSTHTPYGYENLENKAVVDLENPPESIYYE